MIFYDLIDLTEFLIANLEQNESSKAERVSLFYVASTHELVSHEDQAFLMFLRLPSTDCILHNNNVLID
jgi:hypothetical protein